MKYQIRKLLILASKILCFVTLPACQLYAADQTQFDRLKSNENLSDVKQTINVKDKGAIGDGVANDTAAIQAVIDKIEGTGGTVFIPDGTYMIDALTSLRIKSKMTLRLSGGAILKAIPNKEVKYHIILIAGVSNVNIIGGTVQGDRATHTGTSGEWGMGIRICNSMNVLIDGVTAKDCWGDGFEIDRGISNNILNDVMPVNITLVNCIADNNRRQGLSIISANGVIIQNCTFKNTNGADPQAGIDLEPNCATDIINNVQILNCQIFNNARSGITTNGKLGRDAIKNVTISGNNVYNNGEIDQWSHAITIAYTSGVMICGNDIHDNKRSGVCITNKSTGNTVTNNTIINNGNSNRDAGIVLYGIKGNSTGNTIKGNTVTGNKQANILDCNGGNTFIGNIDSNSSPSLTVSHATVVAGGTVNASWSRVFIPTSADWIGIYEQGATGNSKDLPYFYTSGGETVYETPLPGATAKSSGTASIVFPVTMPAGTYELRLYSYNTLITTSAPITVSKADQTITFGDLPMKTVRDAPFTLSATASSWMRRDIMAKVVPW